MRAATRGRRTYINKGDDCITCTQRTEGCAHLLFPLSFPPLRLLRLRPPPALPSLYVVVIRRWWCCNYKRQSTTERPTPSTPKNKRTQHQAPTKTPTHTTHRGSPAAPPNGAAAIARRRCTRSPAYTASGVGTPTPPAPVASAGGPPPLAGAGGPSGGRRACGSAAAGRGPFFGAVVCVGGGGRRVCVMVGRWEVRTHIYDTFTCINIHNVPVPPPPAAPPSAPGPLRTPRAGTSAPAI